MHVRQSMGVFEYFFYLYLAKEEIGFQLLSIKMQEQKKIWILAISINEYKSEAIANLNGCIPDVEKLKGFFVGELNIPEKNFLSISNKEATRDGIISAFRSHFKKCSKGDIALFYFSGHGSWENTSPEFVDAKLEPPGGRNEVIVCHDSGESGVLPIADKELRYLISEIQNTTQGRESKGIQFVNIFDCCHSGSLLRQEDDSFAVRMHPGNKKSRSIEQYLEGQYSNAEVLELPPVDYISLTACSPREAALENENGGIFTNALIDVLKQYEKVKDYPSYADLFSVLREYVQQKTYTQQTPQFEYAGNVNPFDSFLSLSNKFACNYPQLLREDQEWKVNIGAIHGVSWDYIKDMYLPVFLNNHFMQQVGRGHISRIELERTCLDSIEIFPEFRNEIKKNSTSFATWNINTNNLMVGLSGLRFSVELIIKDDSNPFKEDLIKELEGSPFFYSTTLAKYAIVLDRETLTFVSKEEEHQRLITGLNIHMSEPLPYFWLLLNKIRKWEQVANLKNPKTSLISPDKIRISFEYIDYNQIKQSWSSNSVAEDNEPIIISFDAKKGAIPYAVKVKNLNFSPLNFYLIHLDRKYGMRQKNESYLKELMPKESQYLYQSKSRGVGLGIADPHLTSVDDVFLVIASANALKTPYSFEQIGLEKAFGNIVDSKLQPFDHYQSIRSDVQKYSKNEEVNWVIRKFIVKTVQGRSTTKDSVK